MDILGKLIIRAPFVHNPPKDDMRSSYRLIVLATYTGLDQSEAQQKFNQFARLNQQIDPKALNAVWEVSERLYLS